MPSLAEIRAKYPQYNDMDDSAFADAFHKKFYSDMPRSDFDSKLGIAAPSPEAPMSGWSPEQVAELKTRQPKPELSTGETIRDALTKSIDDPMAAVFGATGKIGERLGILGGGSENRGERFGRAFGQSLGPLGQEFAPTAILPKASTKLPATVKAPAVPATKAADLFDETGKLYDTLHALGPYEDVAAVGKIADDMDGALKAGRFSPERQQKAYSVVKDMREELARDGATPGTLESWRKVIKRDLLNSSDGDLRQAGSEMMDTLDDFINSGAGGAVAQKARSTFRKAVQKDKIEFAVRQAERTAERGGKNFTHHLATQLQALVKKDEAAIQKGRPPQFDEAMRKRLDKIASDRGGKVLDWLGNASPDRRIGMMLQVLGFGATGGANVGLQAVLAAGGYAAKRASERSSRDAIEKMMQEIAQ
jgi:hypothetical protein